MTLYYYCIGLGLLFLLGARIGYVNRRLRKRYDREHGKRQACEHELRSIKREIENIPYSRACVRISYDGSGPFFVVDSAGFVIKRFRFDADNKDDETYKRLCAEELADLLNELP